jgi:ABC-type transport system substrate-binding protein
VVFWFRTAVSTAAILLSVATAGGAQSAPATSAAPTTATGTSVVIPGGTALKINLKDQLASNTTHTGDPFQFAAQNDVVVNGYVVIAKGALGAGAVTNAESAAGNGHPGKLALRFDWIYGVDGAKVALSDVPSQQDGEAKKGAASTATIASYVLLGPLGLFAHNFVHGHDVIVKPDQTIPVYVADTVHVVSNQAFTAQPGYAH